MIRTPKFKTCLAHVLRFEGVIPEKGLKGNVDHPKDPGGRTGAGILQREYTAWLAARGRASKDVWEMSDNDRDSIYWERYWDDLKCDDYPLPQAFLLFDTGVLNGVNAARKLAQKTVGVRQDGIIGPITRAALNAVDKAEFLERFQFHRRAYLKTRPAWPTFGEGWYNRMTQVEKIAAAMIRLPSKS